MPMPEAERKRYNRDCHSLDRLKERRSAARTATDRKVLTEELREAYITFDEKWNGYTPTKEQLAKWLR